jgi:formyltetrahydrofolate-dependent phosphoribosylglycinamide formyltransferase
MLKLGVFASGRGSNFSAILKAIREGRLDARVRLMVSNNPDAGALAIAVEQDIPGRVISSTDFSSRDLFVRVLLTELKDHGVDFIVLTGYMKKVPVEVIREYRNRIVNIHPALLPSFGGKGLFGHQVHEAVLSRGCKVSGVTVHIVDEEYDHGPIVAQRSVIVEEGDTPDTLAERVLGVEHQLYAEALQLFAEGKVTVEGRRTVIRR